MEAALLGLAAIKATVSDATSAFDVKGLLNAISKKNNLNIFFKVFICQCLSN